MSVLQNRNVGLHRRCSSDSFCLPLATIQDMAPVQRWDGRAREATDWNELRRVRCTISCHVSREIALFVSLKCCAVRFTMIRRAGMKSFQSAGLAVKADLTLGILGSRAVLSKRKYIDLSVFSRSIAARPLVPHSL